MRSKEIFKVMAVVALVGVMFTSCDENNKPKPPKDPEAKNVYVDASSFTGWKYVSLVEGKEVEITDFKNNTSWDIAFHRMDVRLNGGESGKGKGAALKTGQTELAAVTSIPSSGYIADVMDSIIVSMPPVNEAQPKNLLLSGKWVLMGEMGAYQTQEDVYIVKTAEGKHVKIKFNDYQNAEGKGGHVKFTYVYMD